MKFNPINLVARRFRLIGHTLLLTVCGLLPLAAHAVTTVVNLDTGGTMPTLWSSTTHNVSTVLTGGGAVTNGDGCVVQLGYFSTATTADNFSGIWVPLTGQGGLNSTFNTTSVGDFFENGGVDGAYAMTLVFDPAVAGKNAALPAAGVPLAVRFFNDVSLGSATAYNTVSSDDWLWQTPGLASPTPPTVNMSFDDPPPPLEFESIAVFGQLAGTAFSTTIPISPVPEPSRAMFGMFGLALLVLRRRRK